MVANSFFDEKRSWSRIKDEVLKAYLPPYLAKLSRTKKPIIVSDCFAGKGAFDDGKPGSPLIITEAIANQISNYPSSEIKSVFIEKKYVKDLRLNLPDSEWIHILEGDYESRMEYFIEQYDARGQNLLLYVDPYGIKSILFSHFKRVKTKGFNSVELLLNLNAFGFLREACRLSNVSVDDGEQPAHYERDVNSPERLDEIAGGTYWRDIIERKYSGKITMAQAEEEFVAEYKNRLREVFRYVVNIPIKVKLGNIPKYRIVFGTDHEDGLLLMVDDMCKRWDAFREESRSYQSPLFELDFPDPSKLNDCLNIKNEIVSMIDGEVELKELLVTLVEKYEIAFSTSDYKQHLKEMVGTLIDVRREPEITLTGRKGSSWDHMKKDLTITVSRREQWQPSLL